MSNERKWYVGDRYDNFSEFDSPELAFKFAEELAADLEEDDEDLDNNFVSVKWLTHAQFSAFSMRNRLENSG